MAICLPFQRNIVSLSERSLFSELGAETCGILKTGYVPIIINDSLGCSLKKREAIRRINLAFSN